VINCVFLFLRKVAHRDIIELVSLWGKQLELEARPRLECCEEVF
jgi:hypothetical protein